LQLRSLLSKHTSTTSKDFVGELVLAGIATILKMHWNGHLCHEFHEEKQARLLSSAGAMWLPHFEGIQTEFDFYMGDSL
jgi:hypothetical protein